MTQLDAYREMVKDLAWRRSGEPIFNASMEHASVVVQTLFSTAQESLSILTGSLNPRVYGREAVVTEAKLFLTISHRNSLRIILENDSEIDRRRHPLLIACSNFTNIELRVAPPEVQDRYDFHFLVADADCYRLEGDKNRPLATARFGDAEGAENLNRIFDILWKVSNPVESSPV